MKKKKWYNMCTTWRRGKKHVNVRFAIQHISHYILNLLPNVKLIFFSNTQMNTRDFYAHFTDRGMEVLNRGSHKSCPKSEAALKGHLQPTFSSVTLYCPLQ